MGGLRPPSYHTSRTGGISPREGKSQVTMDASGEVSAKTLVAVACTLVG